jgi:hypothetical protein
LQTYIYGRKDFVIKSSYNNLVQKCVATYRPISPDAKNLQNTFITELAFNKTYTNKFVKNAYPKIETQPCVLNLHIAAKKDENDLYINEFDKIFMQK